ncbi:maleylacetate reductase [Pandoraea cepalis]|uniref:maleylacetate reductase n=1 Tax=Pandoraea cepalis TaxID=2508294 RepID=A0AAW7MPW5_9BURK|nr:maleylacetate reductase [Pandoraea cepalis]MDN4574897.1 maleylacetate reductase [Pandoraea cepalis]MDN4578967.1 maleylacetate reductase [Pandoraea cepalis]
MQGVQGFTFQSHASRVLFGRGVLSQLRDEVQRFDARRVLVLCTPEQRESAEVVVRHLGDAAVGVFDRAVMHVPIEVAEEGREVAKKLRADVVVAFGGGSTIGLGKAIALVSDLPVMAIPTTYAGSEMTPIFGITEQGLKRTGRDLKVLPRTVLYDPELTLTLPVGLSVTSGINAIAHAAEGLYSRDANPVMSLMAEEGIRALASGLPQIRTTPDDFAARSLALYGAWLCGSVLGNVGMSLHHKLCHTLGGSFNLPHAETHTVVLAHVLAFNANAAPEAMRRIERAMGVDNAAVGVYRLAIDNGAPRSLRELGMKEEDVERAVRIAGDLPYWNPRTVDAAGLRSLLRNAYEGTPPKAPLRATPAA